MDSSILDEAIRGIVAHDPRAAARQVLRLAIARSHVDAGAVFRIEGEEPSLLVADGIDQGGLEGVAKIWHESRVRSGEPQATSQALVWPIGHDGSPAGLLYLESRRGLSLEVCRPVLESLNNLLRVAVEIESAQATEVPIVEALPAPRGNLAGREQLVAVLDEVEWNVAMAARKLGTTRVTVYSRLAKYGITRKKLKRSRG